MPAHWHNSFIMASAKKSKTKKITDGLIIMFDGPDGIGKTTQVELAQKELEATGYTVHRTRINGGTPIGEALRSVILSELPRDTETDLYIAMAMYNELAKNLQTQRKQGMVILVDRSPLSIVAYQSYGSGLELMQAYWATDETLKYFSADLILTYHARPSTFLKRFANPPDYFQNKPPEYFERVAKGYVDAAAHYNTPIINADDPIDIVHTETMRYIHVALETKSARRKQGVKPS